MKILTYIKLKKLFKSYGITFRFASPSGSTAEMDSETNKIEVNIGLLEGHKYTIYHELIHVLDFESQNRYIFNHKDIVMNLDADNIRNKIKKLKLNFATKEAVDMSIKDILNLTSKGKCYFPEICHGKEYYTDYIMSLLEIHAGMVTLIDILGENFLNEIGLKELVVYCKRSNEYVNKKLFAKIKKIIDEDNSPIYDFFSACSFRFGTFVYRTEYVIEQFLKNIYNFIKIKEVQNV